MAPSTTFIGTRQPLVDKDGMADIGFLKKLQEWDTKLNQTITLVGQIAANTKIQGRSEGIGTTVTNLTSTGQFNNLDQVIDGSANLKSPQFAGGINLAENGNFEAASTIPPPGWSAVSSVLSYETASPQSGTRSLIITTNNVFGGAQANRKYSAKPGDAFRISGYIFQSALANAGTIVLRFLDLNGNQINTIDSGPSNGGSGSWTFVSATGVAPAGTVSAVLKVQTESLTGATVKFDNVFCTRQATAFEVTPINTAGTPTNTTATCSQVGVTTAINVAATTWQFGDGQVNYNSGSVDPGAFGTYYIYADDPGFAGGAVTYVATITPAVANAANGRLFFGKITTAGGGGGASTGGGSGGGGPVSKAALA